MHLIQMLLHPMACASARDKELFSGFEKVTGTMNVHNIFNPSFHIDDKVRIFAFRAIPNGQEALTSFISVEDHSGRTITTLSPENYPELNAPRLDDPKVTQIGDEFYVTFNTGWVPEGNDIYIMRVYPEPGRPKRVVYGKRNVQERNWAIFSAENEIYALYWINPLKILKLKSAENDSWTFEDFYSGETADPSFPQDLTLGTQLSRSDGKYYFVAHKKHRYQNRKLYLGRFCALDLAANTVTPGKHLLVHSYESMLGDPVKHNPNLFSCTYFSGIQTSGRTIRLGYGINDVDYGFSRHDVGDL